MKRSTGVFVRQEYMEICPNYGVAILLAQIVWLYQPSEHGRERAPWVTDEEGRWIAVSHDDPDGWRLSADAMSANAIRRGLDALVKAGIVERKVRRGGAQSHRTLIRPVLSLLLDDIDDEMPAADPPLGSCPPAADTPVASGGSAARDQIAPSSLVLETIETLATTASVADFRSPIPASEADASLIGEQGLGLEVAHPSAVDGVKGPWAFWDWYALYPRHAGAKGSLRAWRAATKDISPAKLLAATQQWLDGARANGYPEDRYYNATRWLSEGMWTKVWDTPAKQVVSSQAPAGVAWAVNRINARLAAAETAQNPLKELTHGR